MAIQEDAMAKLNKERKGLDDGIKGVNESLAVEEDKCNHLNKLKHKLETTIDDVSIICIISSLKIYYAKDAVVLLLIV